MSAFSQHFRLGLRISYDEHLAIDSNSKILVTTRIMLRDVARDDLSWLVALSAHVYEHTPVFWLNQDISAGIQL